MFFLKEIFVNMTENKICNILASFLDQFEKLMSYQAINVILHYLIIPILLYYEKMKMKNELIETYLMREISNKLINEDYDLAKTRKTDNYDTIIKNAQQNLRLVEQEEKAILEYERAINR